MPNCSKRRANMSTLGQAALAYGERGWRVFPCRPRGKEPLTQHGFKDGTTDPDRIRSWWTRWPDANIGIRTGDGLLVLDIDGDQGKASIQGKHLPPTVTCLTGNGTHYYFTGTGRCRVGIRPGIDIRGSGGYVIAAPSIHPSGAVYSWADDLSPDDIPLAPAPAWLTDALRRDGRDRRDPPAPATPCEQSSAYGLTALEREAHALAMASVGTRNATLNKAAFACGNLIGGGEIAWDDAWQQLWAACSENGLLTDLNDGPMKTAATLQRNLADGADHPRRALMVRVDRRLLTVNLTDGGLRYACLLALVGNVTQKAMAELVGVKPRTIRNWRAHFNQADQAAELDLLQIARAWPTRRFVSAPTALVLDGKLPLTLALHLLALADDRGLVKIGRTALDKRTGIPIDTQAKQIPRLQAAGWLTVSQGKYCGAKGIRLDTNTYRLLDRPSNGAQGLPATKGKEMAHRGA